MAASTTQPRRMSADSGPWTRARYRLRQDSLQRQNSASELAERWSSGVPSRRLGKRTGASRRAGAEEVVMCAPCRGAAVAEVRSGLARVKQRAHVLGVLVDNPGDEIADALSRRVRDRPQLEVLRTVVQPDPVPV